MRDCPSCGKLASCPACVQRVYSNVLASLPDFPSGFDEPQLCTVHAHLACIVVVFDDLVEAHLLADEARGFAKRFLQLADEAERRKLARQAPAPVAREGKLIPLRDEEGPNE